jgi:hypothetical protein
MTRVLVLVALVALTTAACAQPKYDADLGVSGVPVDDGALAGTFARASQAADIAHVPALGDKAAGGQTFALVVRTWDGAKYAEVVRDCAVVDFDVAGVHTEVSAHTARSVPPYDVALDVDHAAGSIASNTFREEWGLRDVPDGSALPTSASDPHVVDMDGDGHPGATIIASGLADGDVFVVQRKTLSFTGVARSKDEAFGLLTHEKEGVILDATNPLLKSSAPRSPDPDPKQSWWHDVRVTGGATCDDVKFNDARPF